MKKILKIFLALTLVAALALTAVSCGGVRSGKDITDADRLSVYKTYNSANKIDLGDYSPVMEIGEYLLLHKHQPTAEKPHAYALYDLDNGEIFGEEAKTLTAISPFAIYNINEKTVIIDTSMSAEGKAIVYYEGNSVTVSGDVSVRISNYNGGALVSVGKYVFYQDGDGNIAYTDNTGVTAAEIVGGANGYYFSLDQNSVLIYDENFNLYGRVVVPSYAVEKTVFALSNGNLLVQYCFRADEYSNDYDYMDGTGSKFILKTLIYEVEKNADREIKFDYKCAAEVKGVKALSKKVTNLVTVYEITDRRIDLNASQTITVALSDAGRVLTTFEKASSLLSSAVIIPTAGEFYTGTNVEGKTMLFDKKLKVKGTFDTLVNFEWGYLGDGVIYDLDGDVIMDIEKENYTLYSVKADCLILAKQEKTLKTYAGETEPTEIITTDYYYFRGEELEKVATYTDDREKSSVSVVRADVAWGDKGSFLVEERDALTLKTTKVTVYAVDGETLMEVSVDENKVNGDIISSIAVIPLNNTNRSLITLKIEEWNDTLLEYQTKTEYYLLENA